MVLWGAWTPKHVAVSSNWDHPKKFHPNQPLLKVFQWLGGLPTDPCVAWEFRGMWWVKPNKYWAPSRLHILGRVGSKFWDIPSDWQSLDLLKAARERTKDYPARNLRDNHKMKKPLIQINAKTLHLRGRDSYFGASPKPFECRWPKGVSWLMMLPLIRNYRWPWFTNGQTWMNRYLPTTKRSSWLMGDMNKPLIFDSI